MEFLIFHQHSLAIPNFYFTKRCLIPYSPGIMEMEPTIQEKYEFFRSVESRWESIINDLANACPPEWQGYVFDAAFSYIPETDELTLFADFQDAASNRKQPVPLDVDNQFAPLYYLHYAFWRPLGWLTLQIKHTWNAEKNRWEVKKTFKYLEDFRRKPGDPL